VSVEGATSTGKVPQGTDRTEVREIEAPRPAPGEATIDVAYAGINFLDVMARRGDAAAWPYGPGLEVSGTIRETGREVTGLAAGQRVAAFTLVPALGGGRLIGTVGRPGRVTSAHASGYDVALARGEDLTEEVRAAAGDAGVDVVLDPLGTTMLQTDLAVTAPGGRIVLFGNAGGGEPAPLPSAGRLIGGNLAVGGFGYVARLRG
jgi:NADPH:quinone reductase-like Zn-dependent oxidoreductase